jgi:hypothetical protein
MKDLTRNFHCIPTGVFLKTLTVIQLVRKFTSFTKSANGKSCTKSSVTGTYAIQFLVFSLFTEYPF